MKFVNTNWCCFYLKCIGIIISYILILHKIRFVSLNKINKMKKILLIASGLILLGLTNLKAQLNGSYSVPGTYTSIAAVVNDLNNLGINGPVTINISAGYTETAPIGGFNLTATGTSANPIIFQKSGIGSNPLISAPAGGAGLPSTTTQDGIWRIIGSDYITFDGIDLIDGNTSSPAYMEFGYGFFKNNATDGCQNNTIKNCVITLNRDNNGSGSGIAADGSRGIEFINSITSAHTTNLIITAASGSHSNNKIYSNTIQNCNIGIAMIGFADVTPFTNADTGNDIGGNSASTGNTIINYGGGIASTVPSAAVRTLAQYNINVSYNTINNNNGSGVNTTSAIRGIYLNTATSANASITNNTLTLKTAVTTTFVSVIENASGATAANNTITINNNLIANCSNTAATTGIWYGIYNVGVNSANLSISNNTFTNNTTNATSGATYLIYNTGGVTNSLNLNNNNLSFNHIGTVAYTGALYSIYNTASSITTTLNAIGNKWSNYNHTVTGTGIIYFFYNGGGSYVFNLSNNLISGLTLNNTSTHYLLYNGSSTQYSLTVTNNTITNNSRNASAGTTYCYYAPSSSLPTSFQNISNNLISNYTATVTGTGSFYGLYSSDGATSPYPRKSITTNTVTNINYLGSGTFYGIYMSYLGDGSSTTGSNFNNNAVNTVTTIGTVYGLYVSSITSPNYPSSVFSNTVTNIVSNGTTTSVYGSYVSSSGAGINFFKNKIYDVVNTGTASNVYGIYATTSPTSNIFNNLVGNLSTPNSLGANRLNGVYIAGGTNINLYYNTVYLNAASTGTSWGSNAIYASTTPNVNLRNNIFVNLSTPTGTETAVAYRRSSTTLTTYSSTSNNNLFYAGTPSASNLIYTDGTTPQQTLASFKTVVSPRDAVSVTENPTFQTTVGSNPNFLNINTITPTQIESGASAVTGILDDYIGTTRNVSTPDIGAWEGNFISSADLLPPSFLANGFTSPSCNNTSRTYTMNITDVTGVASGSLLPRSYYKVNNGPWTSTQGTLTSGNAQNGVYTFSMSYSAVVGDIISYYTVAQDFATTPNLGATPNAGFSGVDVNNITTPPTTPNTFAVAGSLAGTYTVGTSGTFTTLTAAANAYNTYCLNGPVTFVLVDPSYSTNETFPIVFSNNPAASSVNSLLVVPAAANNLTITSTTNTTAIIKFLNSKYITFDGLNSGGSAINIINPNTVTTAGIWLASTTGVGPGNNNITLKNLNVSNGGNTSTNYAILSGVDGASPSTTGGIDNDNITITSNTITSAYYGIYANGTATTAAGLDNWTINNNSIGPVISGTNNIGLYGAYLGNMNTISVINNTISNVQGTSSYVYGIALVTGARNATVNFNTITSIKYNGTGGWGGIGIDVNSNVIPSNITIQNNMLSDISGDGWSSFTAGGIAGIRVAASTSVSGINIQNNSIAMNQSTTVVGYNIAAVSGAIYFGTNASNIDLRNNILYSDIQNNTNTASKTYAIYSAASATAFTNINYNDYFTGGTQGALAFIAAASQTNMAMLVSSFGQNANSLNQLPTFNGINDLHLIPANNTMIDNVGTPIAGITLDIDNQTRSLTTPDIGADEFTAPTCTTASSGILTTPTSSICNNGNVTLSAINTSTGSGTSFQWLVSTSPSGPYTNVVGGSGANTPTYITSALTTNTLYYQLQTVCSAANMTVTSTNATVYINPVPTATISSSSSNLCANQTLSLNVGTNIGTNFYWTGPASFTSAVQNPIITNIPSNGSGNYSVVVSANNCSAAVQVTSVTVNSTNLSINAGPSYICTSGTTTLTVIGNAITYTWSTAAITPTIVETVTATTIYSVAGTGTSNCLATAFATITVINPTITSNGAAVCSSVSIATLTANSFGPVNWYSSPSSTTALATGNTFTATAATTTTYYAQASSTNSGSLQTTLVAGNGSSGNMFDIYAINAITINSVAVTISSTSQTTVEVWYRPGSFVGFESSNAGWTSAGTGTVMGAGNGNPVMLNVPLGINIPAGQTYGIYVTSNGGGTFGYTNGNAVGNLFAQNSDFQFFEGKGGSYFGVTISTRIWNGQIFYTKAGCISPMVPVTLTVNPAPNVAASAFPSTICSGKTTTLTASGADTYTWSTTATGSVIIDSPNANTMYTLSANSILCPETYTAAVTVSVNPSPTVNATSSPSAICAGNTVNINASGAVSYTWNTSSNNTTITVSPSVTTNYTVTGTGSNGCTGTKTITINVNPKPTVVLTAASNTACVNGGVITLTGTPSGGVYSGANVSGNTLNPTATGTFTPIYSYTNSATGCSNTASTSIVAVICTEIVQQSAKSSELRVYPNPNTGSFVIETNNSIVKTIEIVDLTGRIIISEKTDSDMIKMNITDLANGVYHVRIKSDNGTDVIKVIKE